MGLYQIDGLAELIDRFEAFQQNITAQVMPAVLSRTLELAEVTARDFVPVRTGFLRDSIHQEIISDFEGQLIADAPYAGFVENGTSKMVAQPFMQPAAEEAQRSIVNILVEELENAIH